MRPPSTLNRTFIFFLLTAPVCLFTFLLGHFRLEQQRLNLEQAQIRVIKHDVQERLRLYLSGTMGARIVASTFWQQEIVTDREYEVLATKMMQAFPEISAINEVNAEGRIIRVFPWLENKAALGKTSQSIHLLKESHKRGESYWFSPPFDLYQGGRAFICYLPLSRQNKHLGWLGILISTEKLFEFFTQNEFGKNFIIEVTDVKTGEAYIKPSAKNGITNQVLLFRTTLTEFGRQIVISIWPREVISSSKHSWLLAAGLALIFSILATFAYRWWLERVEAIKRLEELNQLLRLTIHDSAASLATIRSHLEIMKSESPLIPAERLSRHVGFVIDMLEQIKLVRKLSTHQSEWRTVR